MENKYVVPSLKENPCLILTICAFLYSLVFFWVVSALREYCLAALQLNSLNRDCIMGRCLIVVGVLRPSNILWVEVIQHIVTTPVPGVLSQYARKPNPKGPFNWEYFCSVIHTI